MNPDFSFEKWPACITCRKDAMFRRNRPCTIRHRKVNTQNGIKRLFLKPQWRQAASGMNLNCAGHEKCGGALVLAMWALFLLAALAMVVASRVSAQLRLAQSVGHRTRASLAAVSGVERALYLACSDTNGWDAPVEPWRTELGSAEGMEVGGGAFFIVNVGIREGGVVTNGGLGDEEARINVNRADTGLLAALFEAVGVERPAAEEMAACVSDWRDGDDEPLTGGAESGYYRSLTHPYSPHNGEFGSVGELLLVKGITPEIFEKIEPHVTVFGDGKVNLNSAGGTVLRALGLAAGGRQSVCDSLAAKVAAYRNAGRAFQEPVADRIVKDLKGFIPLTVEEEDLLGRMMGRLTVKSCYFRGTALGMAGKNSEPALAVDFVIGRRECAVVAWHEH